MNIIALISELEVVSRCCNNLHNGSDATPRPTKERTKESKAIAKRKESLHLPHRLCTSSFNLCRKKLHIMMLLVRLHGCIIYSTNVVFSHPFTISCNYVVRKPKRKSGIIISNCLIPGVFFFSGFLVVFFFSGFLHL